MIIISMYICSLCFELGIQMMNEMREKNINFVSFYDQDMPIDEDLERARIIIGIDIRLL